MAEDVQPETPETDQLAPEEVSAPEGTSAEETPEVESFTDIDPNEAPEGEVSQEWLNERYKQMQADYTRKRQADSQTAKERAEELEFLDALRSDRDTQQEVLEFLREQLEDDESDADEDDDDEDPIAAKVMELSQREEQREAETLARNVVGHIEQLAKDANVELDESDLRDLFGSATSGDAVNNRNTEAAFKEWQKRESDKQAKWLKGYLASKSAPRQVPAGQSATEAPDLSDHDTRVRRMAAILEGNN